MTHDVQLASSAVRDLERIPPRYADAIVTFIYGALAENPQRVGKPLLRELEGVHSARRGEYRVLYRVLEDEAIVLVIRIDHRASIYRTGR